jgi:N utilization substance protein B
MNKSKTETPLKSVKKVGNRRKAREAALRMLYLCDNCGLSVEEADKSYWNEENSQDVVMEFAKLLHNGAWEKREFLDELIIKYAKNWKLDRMTMIDRNILRLAAFEIVETPETPISVIIDEAVEIAKAFSTQDSGKFVNGILDKIKTARKSAL